MVGAQNFEGTIKWSIKTVITDPKQKAQMEEAQKKMDDPATQAQMKQMQARMNDPQFKAMMEANPQMKAQLESMIAGLQGSTIAAMMPTGFIIKIKEQNNLIKIEGGILAAELLALHDKDQIYSLERKNKTYSIMNATPTEVRDSDVKITKTKETAKILNYTCTKYIVEYTSNGTTLNQFVWATPEIRDFDLKSLSKQRFGKDHRIFFDVEGVPLKMEMKINGIDMLMEVFEIKKESHNAADFTIPSDYKEAPSMLR